MAHLVVVEGERKGQAIRLGGATSFGRGLDVDVRLDDLMVSRRHARLLSGDDGRYLLEDLASSNGTFLNGEQVTDQWLTDGDEIQIGETTFMFREELGHRPSQQPFEVVPEKGAQRKTAVLRDSISAADTKTRWVLPKEVARARDLLTAAGEVNEAIGVGLDEESVLEGTLETVFGMLPGTDRACVVLRDPETGELRSRATKLREGFTPEGIPSMSATILEYVLEKQQAVIWNNLSGGDDPLKAPDHASSAMCAPLMSEGEVLGFVVAEATRMTSAYVQAGLGVLASLANVAGFAVANARLHDRLLRRQRIERDLAGARRIQNAFLPEETPRVEGYECHEWYATALEVGGDFYDLVEMPGRRILAVVGDVSGKGITAALMMAKVAGSVRFIAPSEPEPAAMLARINDVVIQSAPDMFITLLVMLLDCEAYTVTTASAGHLWPLLRNPDGSVERLEGETGFSVGMVHDVDYPQFTMPMTAGSVLCAFTDGITEAMDADGEQFGQNRLIRAVGGAPGSAGGVLTAVQDAVRAHAAGQPQSDDITLVCIGRTG
jgi:serine phosphatase RsbU (regulator of sigma subunit)